MSPSGMKTLHKPQREILCTKRPITQHNQNGKGRSREFGRNDKKSLISRLSQIQRPYLQRSSDIGRRRQAPAQAPPRLHLISPAMEAGSCTADAYPAPPKAKVTVKVYIIYYSLHGHVEIMAREVQRGASSVPGVEATLWQVAETLPDRVLEKMRAPRKAEEVPVIAPERLPEADGFLFGFPSRFGMMAAQFKAFFDATGDLWATQRLAGKPAGIFWSTGFHGGGQELTAWTAITQLSHHGIIYVPVGYTFGSGMFEMEEVKGGSSYGAGTYAGDGSRRPTDLELRQAFHQGRYVAGIASRLKAGGAAAGEDDRTTAVTSSPLRGV